MWDISINYMYFISISGYCLVKGFSVNQFYIPKQNNITISMIVLDDFIQNKRILHYFKLL